MNSSNTAVQDRDQSTGTVLWRPSEELVRDTAPFRFAASIGMPDAGYTELWRWSVEDLERLWTRLGISRRAVANHS